MAISFTDFNNLSEQEKKETLMDLKNQIGVSGIVKAWEISRSKVYSMLNDLNIPLNAKGSKKTKTKADVAEVSIKDQDKQVAPKAQNRKKTGMPKNTKKRVTPESALEFEIEENVSKFSLHLETQGSASLISETLQTLLAANKIANSNIQVNITLQEM